MFPWGSTIALNSSCTSSAKRLYLPTLFVAGIDGLAFSIEPLHKTGTPRKDQLLCLVLRTRQWLSSSAACWNVAKTPTRFTTAGGDIGGADRCSVDHISSTATPTLYLEGRAAVLSLLRPRGLMRVFRCLILSLTYTECVQ